MAGSDRLLVASIALATAEAAEVTGLPILTREQLCDRSIVSDLVRDNLRERAEIAA